MLVIYVLPRNSIAAVCLLTVALYACASEGIQEAPEPNVNTTPPAMKCNGFEALCDRPLNEVAFAATHNSMGNLDDGWWGANQEHGLTRQMEDGIRGFLLDSYEVEGELWLCHAFCELGSQPLSEALAEIEVFLTSHSSEIMILFFQDAVGSEGMTQAIESAGLKDLVYTHDPATGFPTMGEMIEANTRLIVSSESHGPPPAWYHYGWDLFFDTPYSFQSVNDFTCELNRGNANNPLFLMNHWVSDSFGLPSQEASATVNRFDILHARATQCWDEVGQIPNLVTVDFYATGDLIAVVNALNGVSFEEKSSSSE